MWRWSARIPTPAGPRTTFFERHGWEGVDGANGRAISIVNNPLFTAATALPPLGPEGKRRVSCFGELYGESFTSLDIVGHELMHGVTHFSVSNRTGDTYGLFQPGNRLPPDSDRRASPTATARSTVATRYGCPGWVLSPEGADIGRVPMWCIDGRFVLAADQAGAIHEGYSDIFGESLGFYYEEQGTTADYLVGGDQTAGPIRFSCFIPLGFYDPDMYGDRYEFALTLDEHGFLGTTRVWFFVDRRF